MYIYKLYKKIDSNKKLLNLTASRAEADPGVH